jgi:MtN3 and saliva related transmembrane protein
MTATEIAPIFGWLASVASTASLAPQAWKIIKSRQTGDISLAMYAVTVTGFCFWTVYGVLLGQWPLILTNSLCLVMSAFILAMKLLPRRGKNAVADAIDPDVGS